MIGICRRGHVRARQRQRKRKGTPQGMVTTQFLLLYSPFGILGTHRHAPREVFNSPGPGLNQAAGHVGSCLNDYATSCPTVIGIIIPIL